MLDGSIAKNGFEALGELDSNGDGRISNQDLGWSELQLWHDLNFNGVTDDGELSSLVSEQVESISLDYVNMQEVDRFGNETRQRSLFYQRVGMKLLSRLIVDVWFRAINLY